jgi:hypothetical protein
VQYFLSLLNANEKHEAGTNYRGVAIRKGARGPTMLHMFYVFLGSIIICQVYKLTLSYQAQVTLKLAASLSNLV